MPPEDDLFEEDEELDKEFEDNEFDEKEKKKPAWFLPGEARTEEEAKKKLKEYKRYIRQLEEERAKAKKQEAPPPAKDGEEEDLLDQINNEDILINPKDTIAKLIRSEVDKAKKEALSQTAEARGEFLLQRASELYPEFDIPGNQDKLYEHIMRYTPEYRKRNGLKVLSEAIETLGGKRKRKEDKHVSAEAGNNAPSVRTKRGGKNPADDIKQSIINAKSEYDVFSESFGK